MKRPIPKAFKILQSHRLTHARVPSLSRIPWFLWDIDPGGFRLRLGVKAVLMIVLSLLLGRGWIEPMGLVMAALCGSTVLLCTQGPTRGAQQITMLLAILTLWVLFALGVTLRTYPLYFHVALVLCCFVIFYLRRFGGRYFLFSVLLVTYLFAAVFPIVHPLPVMIYVALMCVVAFVLYFYVFPGHPEVQSRHQTLTLFYRYSRLLAYYEYGVQQAWRTEYFDALFKKLTPVERVLKQQAELRIESVDSQNRQAVLYELFRVLVLIWDNLRALTQANQTVFSTLKSEVLSLLSAMSTLYIELGNHYVDEGRAITADVTLKSRYEALLQRVYDPEQQMGTGLVYYSNLLFAARRIWALAQPGEGLR